MTVEIRRASYEQLSSLADAAHRDGSRIRQGIDLFGVYADGELVGCGGLRRSRHPGVAVICGAYIDPDHRRQGLATRLVEVREAHARAQGYGEVRAVVLNVWLDSWLRRGYRVRKRYKLGAAEVSRSTLLRPGLRR